MAASSAGSLRWVIGLPIFIAFTCCLILNAASQLLEDSDPSLAATLNPLNTDARINALVAELNAGTSSLDQLAAEAAALVWSALNIWPLFKRTMAAASSPLSPRESECLALAFEGLTARQTGERLRCTERTINYHMANAMAKLKVDNKMSAIQRACWLGVI